MTTVFIDMDGVVADFDGYIDRTLGVKSHNGFMIDQENWAKVREHKRIYSALPVLANAYSLVSGLKQLRDQYDFDMRFLTAVPHRNDMPWAFWDKAEWACKHFPGIPVWYGPYAQDKQHHYRPSDILIDDRPSNIEEWPGQAIYYQGDHELVLNTVENIFKDTK